jgi:Ca-activated chloride channel homolog
VKLGISILLLLLKLIPVVGQYYYRGDVLDEKNKLVPNANIYMHSNKMLMSAGSSGSFGLMSTKAIVDTFTVSIDGYEKVTIPVYKDKYNTIKLKLLASVANLQKNRLASLTKDFKSEKTQGFFSSNETYSNLVENEFIDAKKYPITGFAVNSDKASYSNIRRFINMKSQVPTNAVRIDEMINYFNLPTEAPAPGKTFNINGQLTQCPWNNKNLLLYVNIAAKKLDLSKIPPSNLVFLIDNSGSMELQNRMPLLKSSFKLLVANLREQDTISILTYGGHVEILLHAVSGKYKDSIGKAIESMEASGDTPGESAIKLAYNVAKNNFIPNGNNRVILATDGDFNVGIADEVELEKLISIQSQTGIYLTCLGIGMGNYKDSKLEALAKKGNGNFAYLDTEIEAEKVLVKEMTQTLFSVADKAYMRIQFDTDFVNQYRLIGFDNKLNALADSSSKIDGGEVGSGYSSTILFEIETKASINIDNMHSYLGNDIAHLLIQYQDPKTQFANDCSYTCTVNYMPILSLPNKYRFIAALAMFGSYIKKSAYLPKTDLDEILQLTIDSMDKSNRLQVEFSELVEKAKKVYEFGRAKKKHKKKSTIPS